MPRSSNEKKREIGREKKGTRSKERDEERKIEKKKREGFSERELGGERSICKGWEKKEKGIHSLIKIQKTWNRERKKDWKILSTVAFLWQ